MSNRYRFGIQIISYNRPQYLDKTLNSLLQKVDLNLDKIAVIEQSEDMQVQLECINICKKYSDVQIYPLMKNFGQRGATNYLYSLGYWDDCDFVMMSDHDNIFHVDISIYSEYLLRYPDIWITSGLHSPEHDVENKIGDWVYKSSCRAGHMCMRKTDFYTITPFDEKVGSSAWYAGLDWACTHWTKGTPGYSRSQFIACYPGGVEHIGKMSTWQGVYDDEYTLDELIAMRNMSLRDIVTKYPPRHTYITDKYDYEKQPNLLLDNNTRVYNDIHLEDYNNFKAIDPVEVLAFNYIWPKYSTSFLFKSIEQALNIADKYIIIINQYSYIGEEVDIQKINLILTQLKKFGDKVLPVVCTNSQFPDKCKKDNISYYFELIAQQYKDSCRYLWLVQSDEIYDIENLNKIQKLKKIKNGAFIFNPICYIDTPNWAVTPPEKFDRLSFIDINYFSSLDFEYSKINISRSDVYFHHMSYVMPMSEIVSKFKNWGHRNDIDLDKQNKFLSKIDKVKTDKNITNLHPIIPQIYPSLKYVNSGLNHTLFLTYLNDLMTTDIRYNSISNLFLNTNSDVNTKSINNFSLLKNDDRLLLSTISVNLLPQRPNILIYREQSGYDSLLLKLMTNGNVYSIINTNNNDQILQMTGDDLRKLYHSVIAKSIDYKFNLYNGNPKTICAFKNDSLDMIYFNTWNEDDLESAMVEALPKIKNYGIICGNMANNPKIYNKVSTFFEPHIHSCPWGDVKIDCYENYWNLNRSLQTINPDFSKECNGIWMIRIKK